MTEESTSYGTPWSRIYEVTGCRDAVELAGMLGIRDAIVHMQAGTVPPACLGMLRSLYGINPEWIMSGDPPQYEAIVSPDEQDALRAALQKMLDCVPMRELLRAVRRRRDAHL